MPNRPQVPIALTIAGSDSGGGAGIQADLKTFAALGVHGTSAITCITAQNPKSLRGMQPCTARMVHLQIEAVFDELKPAAVKIGMLYSASIVRSVARFFESPKHPPLIVDPVMVSTSGSRLLRADSISALRDALLPLACLITPNLKETEILAGRKLRSVEDMRKAAQDLQSSLGCSVLVKGGHLKGSEEAVDIFFDGSVELLLRAPFVLGLHTHGTGCTYSAAITAFLARGCSMTEAVREAKGYITRAIALSQSARGHSVLNHAW